MIDESHTATQPRPEPVPARRRRVSIRTLLLAGAVLLLAGAAGGIAWFFSRYRTSAEMIVPVREMSAAEYPEDPAERSVFHGRYNGRRLRLVQKDGTHFDFVFEPRDAATATIIVRDVDVSLMTPSLPEWAKADSGVARIALTDRQWNRQQVSFDARSPHVEVRGGDGWEKAHLSKAALAKNCLNAGLWELLLFTTEEGHKALYYQGWFTFPMGHYKSLFEHNTGLSYGKHWWKLEHWDDPQADGVRVDLGRLRTVLAERVLPAEYDPNERVIAVGEQVRKVRTTLAENVRRWGDFTSGRDIHFATFRPPGNYVIKKPWANEYRRFSRFRKAVLRDVRTPAGLERLQEIELVFDDPKSGETSRFIVGGIDLDALPRLPVADYPKGLYMPMGIGVPPFFQDYEELQANPPQRSPYYSVLLDPSGLWLDHHRIAVDGPVLHRDANDPGLVHLYLLSYERHTLIAHFVLATGRAGPGSPAL